MRIWTFDIGVCHRYEGDSRLGTSYTDHRLHEEETFTKIIDQATK